MQLFESLSICCLIGLSVSVFASETVDHGTVYLSPRLGLATPQDLIADIERPFDEPFYVAVRSKETRSKSEIKNCRDYINLSRSATVEAATEQETRALRHEGIRCLALEELLHAKPAKQSFLPNDLKTISVRDLPPQLSLPVSPEESARTLHFASNGQSIADLEPGTRIQAGILKGGKIVPGKQDAFTIVGNGWSANVTLYGRGDFNGDGIEDLLLRRDGWLAEGTYSISELFVLTKTKPGEVLHVLRSLPAM